MKIKSFYDELTNTLTYVVFDPGTKDAVIIDPVLDFDLLTYKTSEQSSQKILQYLSENNLNLHFILETHVHADHLSGAQVFKRQYPNAKLAISAKIVEVQGLFKNLFLLSPSFPTNGDPFDVLLDEKGDHSSLQAGSLLINVISTPGHTPACISYHIGDSLFTGDALFMPDSGTGRCDFPGGNASDLFDSIHEKIYSLSPETKIYVAHDYGPGGRPLKFETSVAESQKSNIHIKKETKKEDFIHFRKERDQTLKLPKLIFPSVQVNINGGKLPQAMTIPLNLQF